MQQATIYKLHIKQFKPSICAVKVLQSIVSPGFLSLNVWKCFRGTCPYEPCKLRRRGMRVCAWSVWRTDILLQNDAGADFLVQISWKQTGWLKYGRRAIVEGLWEEVLPAHWSSNIHYQQMISVLLERYEEGTWWSFTKNERCWTLGEWETRSMLVIKVLKYEVRKTQNTHSKRSSILIILFLVIY